MKVTELKVGVKMTKNYNSYEASVTALTDEKDASVEQCYSRLRDMALKEVNAGLGNIASLKESGDKEKYAKAERFLQEKKFLQEVKPEDVLKCDRTEHECFKIGFKRGEKNE
jgi:hypothetical protein